MDDDYNHTVGMPGMNVKRPNILLAFLSKARANESFRMYAEILEILQGVLKNNFVF